MGNLAATILGIILLDLVLSGDNAIVIGTAASILPLRQRNIAIIIGGAGAIVLRIVFTGFITWLLNIPYLQIAGGIVLIFITIRLLAERGPARRPPTRNEAPTTTQHRQHLNFLFVLLTIILADTTTSLDNMIAVGALANGNLLSLSIGLLVSITILLIGSAFIAKISARVPWLLDLGAVILAFTAASTILADNSLSDALANNPFFKFGIFAGAIIIVMFADCLLLILRKRRKMATARGH